MHQPMHGGRVHREMRDLLSECEVTLAAVPQFQDLPRAVLVAISRASGDQFRDVEGDELVAELERMGHTPEPIALYNLMFRLRDDGFVDFRSAMGMDPRGFNLIRLGERGRQEVDGWPTPGRISTADVEALISAFEQYADDPSRPEPERRKASAIASAGRDLSIDVAGSILTAWLRSIGLGP